MSLQQPVNTVQAEAVKLAAGLTQIPSDAYFSAERTASQKVKLRALTAVEEMYGYYGADLA